MGKHVHPLMAWLHKRLGDHPDFVVFATMLARKTKREAVADSLRLIAQGHRRPSGDLALDIETTCDGDVTARELLEWPHYARQAKRAA